MSLNVKQKKIIKRIIVIVLIVLVATILLYSFGYFDKDYFVSDKFKEIQFNVLTVNSILLGFMFTSLGIFISTSEIESIKKEQKYVQYDLMVYSIIIGLCSIMISTLINLILIIINSNSIQKIIEVILYTEFTTLILGIVFFFTTVIDLIYVIKRIRKHS